MSHYKYLIVGGGKNPIKWTNALSNSQLCSALVPFWLARGHWAEGQQWTEQALAHTSARAATLDQQRLRAKALHAAAQLDENREQPDAIRAFYE